MRDRNRATGRATANPPATRLPRTEEHPGHPATPTSQLRLVVRTPTGATLLPIDEVECLEASGNVVIVHAANGENYRLREPLSALFAELRPHGFVRVHRGAVLRAGAIVAVEKGRYRKAYCVIRSGAKFEIGRLEFQRLRPLWQAGVLNLEELFATLQLVPAEP